MERSTLISSSPATLLAVLVLVWCVGCAPQFIAVNDLHHLRKGMPREEVLDELPRSPTNTRSFTVDGRTWTVDDFPLQTSQDKTTTTEINYTTNTRRQVETTTDFTNIFLCLYQNGRLRYWGMLGDFSKSEDLQMAELSEYLYNMYLQ